MSATDYQEMPGSPSEKLDARTGKNIATRTLQCDWADRYDVRDYLLGYANRAYLYDDNLFAMSCDIDPFDTPPMPDVGETTKYVKAILKIRYESVIGSPKDGEASAGNITGTDFCEESIEVDTQVISVPSGDLFWSRNPDRVIDDGQAPEKVFSIVNYNVTFHNVKVIPTTFYTLIGTVNIAAYNVDKTGPISTEQGTLLYRGPSERRSVTTFGTAGWDVTLQFSKIMNGDDKGWNFFWDPKEQEWSPIIDSEENPVVFYEEADWSDLGIPPDIVEVP